MKHHSSLPLRLRGVFDDSTELFQQHADGLITHHEMVLKLAALLAALTKRHPSLCVGTPLGEQSLYFALAGVAAKDQYVTWVSMALNLTPDELDEIVTDDGREPAWRWTIRSMETRAQRLAKLGAA